MRRSVYDTLHHGDGHSEDIKASVALVAGMVAVAVVSVTVLALAQAVVELEPVLDLLSAGMACNDDRDSRSS